MKLFSAFTDNSPNKVFISMLLGALAGASYALLIPLVLVSLKEESSVVETIDSGVEVFLSFEVSNIPIAKLFFGIALFILVSRSLSQVILARISMDVAAELRIKIYNRILNAPLHALEHLGTARLIATLTTDVPRIIQGARIIPDLLISSVTLLGMLGVLAYLNSDVFWFVIQCILFGMVTYQIPMLLGRKYFRQSRSSMDSLHGSIQGLIHGIKELKLNRVKQEDFFRETLLKHEQQILTADKRGHTALRLAANYGDLISFFVIGAVSFIFINYHTITKAELVGVIMALLYITGPIGFLLNLMPPLTTAAVSIKKIEKLFKDLPPENIDQEIQPMENWNHIEFKGLEYSHDATHGGFSLGPLDFTLQKGEITFIVGGNGSGKSTLSKLITHHYLPVNGEIRFGQHLVNERNICSARQHISAIYSDYYLFERTFGVTGEGVKENVDGYLKMLGLDGKVTYESGKFSTLALSDGQRRRLALIVSYLDDKSLYVFDEWAADQDPHYKDIFYNKLLPELKAKGKIIVVITHDDRYFDLADQLIVMEDGRIAKKTSTPAHKVNEDGDIKLKYA